MFQNRVLRRVFGTEIAEIKESWKNCSLVNFITRTLHQMFLEVSNEGGGRDMYCV